MDASASTIPDADITNVFNFFIQLDDLNYSQPPKHNTVTKKYTKLPDFDFDSKAAAWSPNSYSLKPGLRRIIQLDDDNLLKTSRSFKNTASSPKIMAPSKSQPKRVMVTISEENENDLHPKFLKYKKQFTPKSPNRATEIDFKNDNNKQSPNNPSSRSSYSPKLPREMRNGKTSSTNKKGHNVTLPNHRGRPPPSLTAERSKMEIVKEREALRSSSHKHLNATLKTRESKNSVIASGKETSKIHNILNNNNIKTYSTTYKRPSETYKSNKFPYLQKKLPKGMLNEELTKKKSVTIHVPLGSISKKEKQLSNVSLIQSVKPTVEIASEMTDIVHYKDAVVSTDPVPTLISQITDMQDFEINAIKKSESGVQTDTMKMLFDSLEIPNVTLTKDKSEPKEDSKLFNITSLPSLEIPPVKVVPQTEEVNSSDRSICQSTSYIISQATRQKLSVTYTTRQKFNFQLLDNGDDVGPSLPPSPLDYPMNVVSVFRNELKIKKTNENVSSEDSYKKKNTPREDHLNHLNDLKSLDCSYVYNRLMKPSDIISTIRVNNGLLQSDICEQFQRELNFIDSFFESLQYLETFSLADKCHTENNIEHFTNNPVLYDSTFDAKNSEYDNFLSKLENGANIDDTETMASKSLCLLNLLIRDEQRRAKNLLFVLKMREDALKDFTKSQILWLEKKKKHDNTDISTLKKKQRGALLKLQHECGEMQRMRKALLTLSEKRKVALMKTMKNIELKLINNVDVEQIILGKKKLKRSTSFDRNAVPLKCFDLSSSGCEESSTAKAISDASFLQAEECTSQCEVGEVRKEPEACEVREVCEVGEACEVPEMPEACEVPEVPEACEVRDFRGVTSVEKCVQTNASYCATDHATDTAAENFVVVDGGYLNILFQNLTLPQIFSSGKHYEVNEEALKNIVNSANSHNSDLSGNEVVEKLMDQIKNKDGDTCSTSPSTARSLIDEFDQYYKDLNAGDPLRPNTPENHENKDSSSQTGDVEYEPPEERLTKTSSMIMIAGSANSINDSFSNKSDPCICKTASPSKSQDGTIDTEPVPTSQAPTGPLPVPVGAAAVVDSQPPDVPTWLMQKSTPSSSLETSSESSQSLCVSTSLTTSVSAPVHVEAEELRRQQLAIEREIKALEQQQCRLLVVREIPDKPPPPYTPPTETRAPKPSRIFSSDEHLEDKVEKCITDPDRSFCESSEPYIVFVQDYCQESLERLKQEQSDMPWDACNLLPQKPSVEIYEMVEKTSSELKDVLTCLTPSGVSGVSSRRSDHIDDILFAEWRRCEPEWTALHADEATVKNQIFESIFQKILTDTIDTYKKTVQCEAITSD